MAHVQTGLNQPLDNGEDGSPKLGWVIILFAIILMMLSLLLALVLGVLNGQISGQVLNERRIGQIVGATFAPIIVSFLIVAFFQIFKKFRNRRSRWKIYCWSLVVVCVSTLAQILQHIAPAAGV